MTELSTVKPKEKRATIVRRLQSLTGRHAVIEPLAQASDRFFHQVFEKAGIGMAVVDINGRIVEANLAFEEMLGYDRGGLTGVAFTELTHPEDVQTHLELFRELLHGQRDSYQIEKRCICRNGVPIWSNLTVSRVSDDSGQSEFLIGVILNVTAHANAEKELRNLTRALRTLNECHQALLHIPDEDKLLREISRIIVQVGGYTLAWVGYAENDENKSIRAVACAGAEQDFIAEIDISWADRKNGRGITATAIREGRLGLVNDIAADREGAPWRKQALKHGFQSALALPLAIDGKTIGSLTIFACKPYAFATEDVSLLQNLSHNLAFGLAAIRNRRQRQEMEQEKDNIQAQLFQSQKMEALGRLAGGITHDFNNLLTEIIGYSELLLGTMSKEDPRRSDIETIKAAGERAGILTHQLLAFSRKQVMQTKFLRLNKVVSEMQHMLRRMIGEDIETVTYLDPLVECIKADRGQIEQVILNLVVNARHAMPRGGKLVIGTELATLSGYDCKIMPESRPGTFICLSVTDNGVGMDEQTARHIFDPFFTTKGPTKGSGLGLSVVYGIIKQHAGWITVASQLNEGTTFKVYLPAHPGKEDGESKNGTVSIHQLQGQGQSILLVEDEEGVRRFATDTLERNGYRVIAAANAKEALAMFHREMNNFKLLFTDVVLPDFSGPELTEQFLSYNPDLKILITSGHTFEKLELQNMEAGHPFLQKPYSVPSLLQAIKTALK